MLQGFYVIKAIVRNNFYGHFLICTEKECYNILRCWSPGPNEIQVITVYDGAHKR